MPECRSESIWWYELGDFRELYEFMSSDSVLEVMEVGRKIVWQLDKMCIHLGEEACWIC